MPRIILLVDDSLISERVVRLAFQKAAKMFKKDSTPDYSFVWKSSINAALNYIRDLKEQNQIHTISLIILDGQLPSLSPEKEEKYQGEEKDLVPLNENERIYNGHIFYRVMTQALNVNDIPVVLYSTEKQGFKDTFEDDAYTPPSLNSKPLQTDEAQRLLNDYILPSRMSLASPLVSRSGMYAKRLSQSYPAIPLDNLEEACDNKTSCKTNLL